MPKPSDLLQGTVDLLILRTLSREPLHGWAISKRIQQLSGDVLSVQQGSLYPALHRLEQQGWIDSEWKDTELGRSAKFYALTREGKLQLEREVALLRRGAGPQEGVDVLAARPRRRSALRHSPVCQGARHHAGAAGHHG